MEENRKKALIEAAKKSFKPEDLDSFVHELKAQEAAGINNDGVDSQLEYMIEKGGIDWVREILGTEKK